MVGASAEIDGPPWYRTWFSAGSPLIIDELTLFPLPHEFAATATEERHLLLAATAAVTGVAAALAPAVAMPWRIRYLAIMAYVFLSSWMGNGKSEKERHHAAMRCRMQEY